MFALPPPYPLSPPSVGLGGLVSAHTLNDFSFSQSIFALYYLKGNRIAPGHKDNLFYVGVCERFFHKIVELFISLYTIPVMRRLWNRPDMPVWSLSTLSAEGVGNMNICTYVTAISMEPKLMQVAVYHNTQTHKNIKVGGVVLLQLLSQPLAPIVRICGQQSGSTIDKIKRLQKRYALNQHGDLWYLEEAAGFLELHIKQILDVGGDHDLIVGEVTHHKNLSGTALLTTDYLKEHQYIR